MKTISKIFILAAVAGLFAACNDNDDIVPDTPAEGKLVRLTFGTADAAGTRAVWKDETGKGNLIFNWDSHPASPPMMAVISDGYNFIGNYSAPNDWSESQCHTGLIVTPQEDPHYATFETERYYYENEISASAQKIFVTTGSNNNTTSSPFLFNTSMQMPNLFTQQASQQPDFLRDCMILYGEAEMMNGSALIPFKHVPATFRFIITNERPAAATTIKSVQVSLVDAEGNIQPVASQTLDVIIESEINTIELFYGGNTYNTHTSITTWLGQNGTAVAKGEQYIAYAMALPVGKADTGMPDENAFKDKKIQFTIEALGPDNEHLSFELDADKLAAANPGNVYNWVGGKSYTIRMSLDDGLLVQDITVDDWNEQDIAGGEAVEWVNGFSETGDYEPAQLNASGYYEIKNGGNLFWFANHVNTADRTANAVLTADIDLEGRPWTPIGSTGEENNNFRGVFDGQNYTIRGLNVEGGRAGLGFFGEVRTGIVRNFTIYGEVVVNTEVDYVGGVIGSICGLNGENDLERNGAIIQNITSYVNLTAKVHGPGMIGGFVGYANHQSLIEKCSWYGTFDAGEYRVDSGAGGFIGKIQENTSEVTIRNCAAYGTIKTNYAKNSYNNTPTIYMGGFLSFSNTGAKTTLENCLFAGKFERGANLTDEARLGAFGTLRSVNAIKNCYYLADDGLEAVHSDSNLKPGSDNVEITAVTEDDLRNNTIATQLGEYWTQGENYPVIKK
ncbi:hypothetical protein [Barnesiella intestinihominis]|uniref:hypothetical protein n=1 Tax=Barnesiella intestinihominis TaxID=487174 RepID=UPI00266C5981|nr:hypothetical protein [Barnesiella intestinihominis]